MFCARGVKGGGWGRFFVFFLGDLRLEAVAISRRFFVAQPFLLTCLPRAIPRDSGGTFSVIAEPAAMYAPSPILIGATSTESLPTKTRLPMVVWSLFTPS